jgi:hypothetical protein
VDSDLKVVSRSAAEPEFCGAALNNKMVFYILGLIGILSGNINRNFVAIATHEVDIPGSQIEAERDSGR